MSPFVLLSQLILFTGITHAYFRPPTFLVVPFPFRKLRLLPGECARSHASTRTHLVARIYADSFMGPSISTETTAQRRWMLPSARTGADSPMGAICREGHRTTPTAPPRGERLRAPAQDLAASRIGTGRGRP
ncbi:hypothetical protein GGX14DRAFT_612016 [Mycena pura]|uniref:Secreted protein n=1 Tax=Mycena pura TaxID=153505 RepID=A0AAD6YSS1_9AGAR|nr:hypothetical protein GGX14DRAFT_612016 [Mycena pura]